MSAPNETFLLGERLFSPEDLSSIVARVAGQIDADYQGVGESLVLLGVLKGALYFLSDLSRRIQAPHQIDLIGARSYDGTQSTGAVAITKSPDTDLTGKHVIVVEDIYDTGRTLATIEDYLRRHEARSVALCSLFAKRRGPVFPANLRYIGAEIDDRFIVGYGLDCDEAWRHLPYVAVLTSPSIADPS